MLKMDHFVTKAFFPDGNLRFMVKEVDDHVDACWLLRHDVTKLITEIYESRGTCNKCDWFYVHGSNLVCGFMTEPLEADGFCNHFKAKEK